MKKIKFTICQIHCKSCTALIESELKDQKGIQFVKVDLDSSEAKIKFNENQISLKEIKTLIEKLGYSLKKKPNQSKKQTLKAYAISGLGLLIIALGYLYIEKSGSLEILSSLQEANINLFLILVIGFLASFHCVGMCGGLVVAYSSQKKPNVNKFGAHVNYNLGRLISYTVTGLVLGGIGSFFALSPKFGNVVVMLAGAFMIIMGFSLLTNLKILKKIENFLPSKIAKLIFLFRKSSVSSPVLIGLLNGFMPCGPLQAMQIYALSTVSPVQGAVAMAVYGLGTIPIMFGFGSIISLLNQERIKHVTKLSGLIVIVLGILMLGRGFNNSKHYLVQDSAVKAQAEQLVKNKTERATEKQKEWQPVIDQEDNQVVITEVTYAGYKTDTVYLKKDTPVKWIIKGKEVTRCTDEIVLYLAGKEIRKEINNGEEKIIYFTPKKPGEIRFSCWMKMVWGKFIVK
ncbi:MAG: hypothetical protein GF347_01510 [Candidatus Moranbacteria bacterium]|nr:hypothetical protein [Candidatus Moranbacteria bacterium]